MEETIVVVTQGTSVQPTDVVVTVQVGQMDSQRTPEVYQVSMHVSIAVCIPVCNVRTLC